MIYLIGGAGAPNYGDELIVRSWLEYLSEECQREKLLVESHNLTVSSSLNSETNGFAQFINPLRTIARYKRGLGFWEQLSRGWSYGNSSSHMLEKLYSLPINFIKSCRLIHIVGGGYIHTKNEVSGFLVGAAAGLSKRFRIPLYGTGLGFMPMNNAPGSSADIVKKVFCQFQFLEVRDKESFAFLQSVAPNRPNFLSGVDDCFLRPVKSVASHINCRPALHISCGKHALKKMIEVITSNLQGLISKFGKILFWECFPNGDLPSYTEIRKILPEIELVSVCSLLRDGIPFTSGDYMITTRFHPHLVFSRIGGHGCFISSGKYYNTKHGSIVSLGSDFVKESEARIPCISEVLEVSLICKSEKNIRLRKKKIADTIYKNHLVDFPEKIRKLW